MAFRDSYGGKMEKKRKSPLKSLPRILCDFNSVGWSGDEGDDCYYSFDAKALASYRACDGMRVFIYEPSRDQLVMGCEAELERYQPQFTDEARWRLRPVPNTGYLGELD